MMRFVVALVFLVRCDDAFFFVFRASSRRLYLSQRTEAPISAETAIEDVVTKAAEALRDGWRRVDLASGAAEFQQLVSKENRASDMSAKELAVAIEAHRSVYGPLLAFDDVADVSVVVSSSSKEAVCTTILATPTNKRQKVNWRLSRLKDQWLIDDVGLEEEDEEEVEEESKKFDDLDEPFAPSPSWVATTVLKALRRVDEPVSNSGCDVALRYVSDDNPSSSLTREIFRSYLDDKNYPYGILTRWTDLTQELDVVIHDDDDDTQKRRATLDMTLTDDDEHDNKEWVVTFEFSKASPTAGWKIDKVWCDSF